MDVENDLRKAVERREFLIYYQAKVDVRSRRITGAEALIRWRHPRRGILSPAHFLPAAIDTGLIRSMDEWMLREACLQSRRWQAAGLAPITVSVNVSNSLFHGSTLVPTASKALSESGLASQYLELELTESIAMRDMDTSITMLEDLKRMGIRLSIDDFGTGYSSLSYLQRLPLSRLKIDQSFVRNLGTDEHNERIIRAIIALAHSFPLPVLAEGVETEEQFRKLEEEGCDEVQGYLFSRPTNAEEFERFLRRDADSRRVA